MLMFLDNSWLQRWFAIIQYSKETVLVITLLNDYHITATLTWPGSNAITREVSHSAFTCSKLTIETLAQGVKYVQS